MLPLRQLLTGPARLVVSYITLTELNVLWNIPLHVVAACVMASSRMPLSSWDFGVVVVAVAQLPALQPSSLSSTNRRLRDCARHTALSLIHLVYFAQDGPSCLTWLLWSHCHPRLGWEPPKYSICAARPSSDSGGSGNGNGRCCRTMLSSASVPWCQRLPLPPWRRFSLTEKLVQVSTSDSGKGSKCRRKRRWP